MGIVETIRFRILPYWKTFIVILLPLLLLPLPIIGQTQEARAGYGIIIIAVFWMTEALPLAITSLLPVVLFPLLGVMSTTRVCPNYMKEASMMFMGSIFVALAVERCNLHQRIALKVLTLVGARPRWLLLGIMLTTMFLSMWISNTATAALMVPIVKSVIHQLLKGDEQLDTAMLPLKMSETPPLEKELTINQLDQPDENTQRKNFSVEPSQHQNLRTCFFLSVAYCSNIGGTGTQTGAGPQMVLKGILQDLYGPETGLNFATWMTFSMPGMLINIFLTWIWLQYLFIGFKQVKHNKIKEKQVNHTIRTQYNQLGPITFQEVSTIVLFSICILLWFFRNPTFIGKNVGWGRFFPLVHVDDVTPVMFIVAVFFVIPAKPKFWFLRPTGERGPEVPSEAILDWEYIQKKTPWGVFLIAGAGFALSDVSKESGLSVWLGTKLTSLEVLPPFALLLAICLMTASVTEMFSNSATAGIILPIIAKMAEISHINPLSLMVPVAVTCSYAFMLPAASPPNTIVFEAAKIRLIDMIKAGFLMNIVGAVVISLSMITLGDTLFDIYTLPDWALQNVTAGPSTSMVN